jgi:hypothetical protein
MAKNIVKIADGLSTNRLTTSSCPLAVHSTFWADIFDVSDMTIRPNGPVSSGGFLGRRSYS